MFIGGVQFGNISTSATKYGGLTGTGFGYNISAVGGGGENTVRGSCLAAKAVPEGVGCSSERCAICCMPASSLLKHWIVASLAVLWNFRPVHCRWSCACTQVSLVCGTSVSAKSALACAAAMKNGTECNKTAVPNTCVKKKCRWYSLKMLAVTGKPACSN
jgi:hypothetical protein